jgi:hypothetical protein
MGVGYGYTFDPGSGLLPCSEENDSFDRGGVGFDIIAINKFAQDHGLNSATLKFQQDTGNAPCIDHIGINGDPAWHSLESGQVYTNDPGNPDTLAQLQDGDVGTIVRPQMAPTSGGLAGQADVLAPLAFMLGYGGSGSNSPNINPNIHFVFVGDSENLDTQQNGECYSTISSVVNWSRNTELALHTRGQSQTRRTYARRDPRGPRRA